MLENDMIRAIIAERIAQAAVLRRPAAPAPVTAAQVRAWGPRASRPPLTEPPDAMTNLQIPRPRDPLAATDAGGQPGAQPVRVAVDSAPPRPAARSDLQVVEA